MHNWNVQIKRVKDNITPFLLIGVVMGCFIGAAKKLKEYGWLNNYLEYANISLDYADMGNAVMFEHLAPNTLVILLFLIFLLSALRRIFFGALEAPPKEQKGVIFALENFASLLAIAWLGMMLGIMLPAWWFEDWRTCAKFAFLAIYPVLYLIEVTCVSMLAYSQFLYKLPIFTHERPKWKIQTRLEGFVILCVALVTLTYHKQLTEFTNLTGKWLHSLL